MKTYSILLVDDEQDILDLLSYTLKKYNFQIHTAKNGIDALKQLETYTPDIILLDLMMPGMDGIEVCQIIRNDLKLDHPLISFLTARSEDYSHIAGLEAGADDYITKPIRPRLLVSKLQSLLRRSHKVENTTQNESFESNNIKINREQFHIEINDEKIILPKKEFELLEFLAKNPGKVFVREQILNAVWGNDTIVGDRTIDVHIRKLREKLGDSYIRTIKGIGYSFDVN